MEPPRRQDRHWVPSFAFPRGSGLEGGNKPPAFLYNAGMTRHNRVALRVGTLVVLALAAASSAAEKPKFEIATEVVAADADVKPNEPELFKDEKEKGEKDKKPEEKAAATTTPAARGAIAATPGLLDGFGGSSGAEQTARRAVVGTGA